MDPSPFSLTGQRTRTFIGNVTACPVLAHHGHDMAVVIQLCLAPCISTLLAVLRVYPSSLVSRPVPALARRTGLVVSLRNPEQ